MSSTTQDVAPAAATPALVDDVQPPAQSAQSSLASQLRSFAAGGFGGICAVVVGHPFDLVKVRLQTADRGVYSSAVDVVRKSVARDGLRRGLYAGVSAPLVGVTPMFAVSFWGYDAGKQLVASLSPPDSATGGLSIPQIAAAGFLSAIPMTAITAPFERVKVILQVQGQRALAPGEKPRYSGGLDVVRQLYRDGGLRSVFRGSAATLARDGPGSAAYFAAYEYIKRALSPRGPDGQPTGQLSLTAITCAGAAAGVAMWIPVFPVDTVKSRLQTAEGSVSIAGVVRELYGKGGYRAFFPGFGPALARAIPANAATFLGVELAHQAMNKAFN
ncbi:Mitochondrial carnitine carrier [Escovopsis weberi]|uniref:Mitochondrial carnitine carrier n=1 Tax=Escovopsis weberi TaxID=150374 RepID=A0A0M8N0J3_ESCWE|nr:Mitochondrial carnitine carrier [Escovopsis weberi]